MNAPECRSLPASGSKMEANSCCTMLWRQVVWIAFPDPTEIARRVEALVQRLLELREAPLWSHTAVLRSLEVVLQACFFMKFLDIESRAIGRKTSEEGQTFGGKVERTDPSVIF